MKQGKVDINETIKWQDITVAGTIKGGASAKQFKTGDWRVKKPVFIEDKCKQCLLCVPVCPDSSIPVKNSKRLDFDFDHCKGCGICVEVCPFDAIEFVDDIKGDK